MPVYGVRIPNVTNGTPMRACSRAKCPMRLCIRYPICFLFGSESTTASQVPSRKPKSAAFSSWCFQLSWTALGRVVVYTLSTARFAAVSSLCEHCQTPTRSCTTTCVTLYIRLRALGADLIILSTRRSNCAMLAGAFSTSLCPI